jgi:Tol biopolymer transport system component
MTRHNRITSRGALALTLIACGLFLSGAVAPFPDAEASNVSPWSLPINLGSEVNSPFSDFAPHLSADGLSLYFASTRPDSRGREDLWVSHRTSRYDSWDTPTNLGAAINTEFDERSPALSLNGHLLFFATDRPGGSGGLDVWISWRADTRDDLAWETPVNLGTGINTIATDAGPSFFEHGGWDHPRRWPRFSAIPQLFMASNRPGGAGGLDIYVGAVPGGWFGPPSLVAEINSPQADLTPSISRDGLELVLASDRPGTVGGQDLYVATRKSLHHAWSSPQNLGPLVNSTSVENFPALSADRENLYFTSSRPGGFGGSDLYLTTRW